MVRELGGMGVEEGLAHASHVQDLLALSLWRGDGGGGPFPLDMLGIQHILGLEDALHQDIVGEGMQEGPGCHVRRVHDPAMRQANAQGLEEGELGGGFKDPRPRKTRVDGEPGVQGGQEVEGLGNGIPRWGVRRVGCGRAGLRLQGQLC
jgi:hypothetical protein